MKRGGGYKILPRGASKHTTRPHLRMLDGKNSLSECLDFRGPVATLFISCDTCSDRIAELFAASFCGGHHANYHAICCKMEYCTDVPVWG